MDKPWLKQYPAGVPAEIDASQYRSLAHLLEDSFQKNRNRRAFECMGKVLTYGELDTLSRQLAAWQQAYDAWITPVLGRPPLEIGAIDIEQTDVMKAIVPIEDYVPFTAMQNVTGQPAISLPLARSKANLPIGTQFVGRFGEEHVLLQLAAQIVSAEPWGRMRPPVYG